MSNKYIKENWEDRNVQYPTRYTITKSGGGAISSADDVTMTTSAGTVTEAGTNITKARMNNIEDGLESALNSKESNDNVLSNTVAGMDDISVWTTNNCTLGLDKIERFEGNYCVKTTLTSTTSNFYRDVLSKLDTSKYYLFTAYFKNGDLTNIQLDINLVGGAGVLSSSTVSSTTWTRVGVIVKPDDFTSATNCYISLYTEGSIGEFAYVDGLSINEITATEYGEGASALLDDYPFSRKTGIQTTNQIEILASNSFNGELACKIKGNTVTNLLDDNDAGCESTSGWGTNNCSLAVDTSNELEGTNCFKMTLTNTTGNAFKDFLTKVDTSKYYLFSAYVKIFDVTSIQLDVNIVGGGGNVSSSVVTSDEYIRVGVVRKPSDFSGATNCYISLYCEGANTEYAFIEGIQINEISAYEYGLGATAILDNYPFHLQMKDTEISRVKTVGKNLFNKNDSNVEIGYQIDNTDGTESASSGENASSFIKIYYDNDYYISGCDNTTNTDGAYYDEFQNYISGFTSYGALTIPSNAHYLRFTIDDDDLNSAQLEVGTSQSSYEDYIETSVYSPTTLRSVPNISDIFNVDTGILETNIGTKVLLSGDIDSVANGTNLQRAVIGLDAFTGIKTQTASTIDYETLVNYHKGETNGNDTSGDDYKWYTDASNLYLLAPLGTWADVSACRTALTSTVETVVNYQLATPTRTQYTARLSQNYTNGTLYNENVVRDISNYDGDNNGIEITNTSLPIKFLLNVYEVDLSTKNYTLIDIDDCTIASDGLSFTVSGATEGAFYIYEYEHKFYSSRAIIEYAYAKSQKSQSDNLRDLLNKSLAEINKLNDLLIDKTNIIKNTGTVTSFPTNIPASSSETQTIPLGIFATAGVLLFKGAAGGLGVLIHFNTNENDAISLDHYISTNVSIRNFSDDGLLAFNIATNVDLDKCYIDGTNLKLVWTNNDGVNPRSVTGRMIWEVTK